MAAVKTTRHLLYSSAEGNREIPHLVCFVVDGNRQDTIRALCTSHKSQSRLGKGGCCRAKEINDERQIVIQSNNLYFYSSLDK